MSFFRCPLCAAPLTRGERAYVCPGGHSFDRSAAGYVHLLPANRKHSQNPGDDKAMVAARSAFLEKGYYSPLREALCGLALRDTADLPAPALLDSGCGEGYYTAGIYAARAGLNPVLVSGPQIGGQLTMTTDIENFPGFAEPISGPQLMENMRAQAQNVGVRMVDDKITEVDFNTRPFVCSSENGNEFISEAPVLNGALELDIPPQTALLVTL